VLIEVKFIEKYLKVVPELKDLFMEQIFICAFLGHGEFLQNYWIEEILSFQIKSGCFTYDNVNCSPHMNGLAAASLSLFGKFLQ
jgi:hypothetical protein